MLTCRIKGDRELGSLPSVLKAIPLGATSMIFGAEKENIKERDRKVFGQGSFPIRSFAVQLNCDRRKRSQPSESQTGHWAVYDERGGPVSYATSRSEKSLRVRLKVSL